MFRPVLTYTYVYMHVCYIYTPIKVEFRATSPPFVYLRVCRYLSCKIRGVETYLTFACA